MWDSAHSSPLDRCSMWIGGFDHLFGQRSKHEKHRHLHGIDWQCTLILSAAREVALTKPIIVIKPGQTAEAARSGDAPGAMIGSDAVLDAAFRRCGVLRVKAFVAIV